MTAKGFYTKYFLFNNIKIINFFLTIFWVIGIFLIIFIINLYFNTQEESRYMLLSSLGIIISAFIASISMIKSIYENKENEKNKFLLEKLIICQELAIEELNEMSLNLSSISNSLNGFINADDGEPTKLSALSMNMFNELESKPSYAKLVWYLRCYFPKINVRFQSHILNIKQASSMTEVQDNMLDFLHLLDIEQLKYIINKDKIIFKK